MLRNGASGGSVSATTLDDYSVTTFFTWCASVLETKDKHGFSTSELDYLRRGDLNSSSSVASDCIVLDCVDAESSPMGNMNVVHRDTTTKVTNAFVSNNKEPMFTNEKMEGALQDEYNANVKNIEVFFHQKEKLTKKVGTIH